MKKTMLKLMLPLAAAICAAAAPLSSFAEAKEATLKATGYSGSTTLTDFQALVKLSEGDDYGFSYNEAGGASHYIWFTSADGTTVYPHEIDKWDTSGDSFVWVRLPELKKGTTFKMHWNDSAGDVQSASGNVWDGFVGVWHMNETGTTAEPDSTGNNLSAAPTAYGNNTYSSGTINTNAGKVASGRTTGAKQGFLVDSYADKFGDKSQNTFSVGGWFYSSEHLDNARLLAGYKTVSTRNSWGVLVADNNIQKKIQVYGRDNSAKTLNLTLPAGAWHHIVLVCDGTTAAKLYYDGTAYDVTLGSAPNLSANNVFSFGGVAQAQGGDRSLHGTLDEVRMYDGVLSADRIAADYATMNNPTNFLTFVPAVTHRWSFTSDYTDSVGGTPNGSLWGGTNPSFANGQVTFPGTGWGSGSADLGGPGLTGGGDTTIEIWAKNNALSAAEIMFEYGAPKTTMAAGAVASSALPIIGATKTLKATTSSS